MADKQPVIHLATYIYLHGSLEGPRELGNSLFGIQECLASLGSDRKIPPTHHKMVGQVT